MSTDHTKLGDAGPKFASQSVTDVVYNRDVIFEMGKNQWDIPAIRRDRIVDLPDDARVGVWVYAPRIYATHHLVPYRRMTLEAIPTRKSMVFFYHLDHKFETVWERTEHFAADLVDGEWMGVIPPNFSMWEGLPEAVYVWQMYRSRWIARYFQEAGLKIIPDIPFGCDPDAKTISVDDHELSLAGMPKHLSTISIQTQTADPKRASLKMQHKSLRVILRYLKPGTVLVYGIGKGFREAIEAEGVRCIEAASWSGVRRSDFRRDIVHAGKSVYQQSAWHGAGQGRLW